MRASSAVMRPMPISTPRATWRSLRRSESMVSAISKTTIKVSTQVVIQKRPSSTRTGHNLRADAATSFACSLDQEQYDGWLTYSYFTAHLYRYPDLYRLSAIIPHYCRLLKTPVGGLTFVYECASCGKQFFRKQRTQRLNQHKDRNGYPCPGRYAHWVDTR